MDFGFEGFETPSFDTEIEDFEVKKVRKFLRNLRIGEGGSFIFSLMHERIIYATSGDHYVYAVDVRRGKELWKFRTGGANYGAPSTDGFIIFVPSYDGHVYALDIKTGKEIWRFRTDGKIFSTPYVDGEIVVFGSEDYNIYAVERKTGKLIWRFATGGESASSPMIYKGMVFTGSCDHNFYCIDLKTGKEVWRFTTGDDVMLNRPTLVHSGRVYFPSFDNYLYCLDAKTGKEIWRFRTGKYGNSGPPILYKNRIYHVAREGIVYCLTLDGNEIWRFRTGGMTVKTAAKDGVVYFGSEDRHFYALDVETGKEIWKFKAGGRIYDEAKVFGDIVCFGCSDCNYYVLNKFTGEEIWRFQSSDLRESPAPPPYGEFELKIKKETHIEEAVEEGKYKKKKEETVSLSDYHVESEYSTESEYKQKSEYETSFVVFEPFLAFTEALPSRCGVCRPRARSACCA
ncbi:MAG: PQQ-binding-like beta-propeller repeat protein [Candidatus Aenigmarchaeota archaeon]|nr:PQQ-binding-like beta-propeller repeat protein [Candidatus Aenigmarchaeota archaeon]